MKEIQQSKLKLNKKVVTILSNVQQQQVQGGVKAGPITSVFQSMFACDTLTCCTVTGCSLLLCDAES